jgi:hypothetical protein
MLLAGDGKTRREERLVKALRDYLRRRKAPLREAAKGAGEREGVPLPARPVEPKRSS